jgi:hypothetical protein
MATSKKETEKNVESTSVVLLEERKVKALEKIAKSLDALTSWVEDIDKAEWSERIQYYLYEFLNKDQSKSYRQDKNTKTQEEDTEEAEFVRPTRRIVE